MEFTAIKESVDQFEHLHDALMGRECWVFVAEGRRAAARLDRAARAIIGVSTPAAATVRSGLFHCMERTGYRWRASWLTAPKRELSEDAVTRMVRLFGGKGSPSPDRDVLMLFEDSQRLLDGLLNDVRVGSMRFLQVDARTN